MQGAWRATTSSRRLLQSLLLHNHRARSSNFAPLSSLSSDHRVRTTGLRRRHDDKSSYYYKSATVGPDQETEPSPSPSPSLEDSLPSCSSRSPSRRTGLLGWAPLEGGDRRGQLQLARRQLYHRSFFTRAKQVQKIEFNDQHSQRAVTTALWCNFLVFSLKFGVWLSTSSHVMLAEVVHSVADFANQALLAYGLTSSRRAPDAIHPYGYSKERFVWSLISAVGIFCLGSGATIVNGIQNLWTTHPPENMKYAALVIGGSFIIEGASLLVAIQSVKKGAAAEGMTIRDYVWRGHDPTSVAVMTEDGAAVAGLAIAGASLVAVNVTGNGIYDPIGSIIIGNLLGMVAIFLIQRNRHALIGRAMDDQDMEKVLRFLKNDPVVDSLYDCKSEVIGPGFFRFKAEIDFNGVKVVQNYLSRTGREEWARQFREAANEKDDTVLVKVMANYGEEVVTALGSEVDRLEKEIQDLVPGIRHVDIEAHNPIGPL